MMENDIRFFRNDFFLSAGRCNAQGELPLSSLIQNLIDTATAHANSLDFGYDRLTRNGAAWVLSRIAVEMKKYPRINESFSIETWIVSTNRLYSDRAYRIVDSEGNEIGSALSRWVAIDIASRKPVNLIDLFSPDGLPDTGIQSCITAFSRPVADLTSEQTMTVRFGYSDIDCNRHVNSRRYVEHILDMFSVSYFDSHRIGRFEIVYHAEAHYADVVEIETNRQPDDIVYATVKRGPQLITAAWLSIADRK